MFDDDVYLVLVKWPNSTEGLIFPRPGNVPLADTYAKGRADFDKAVADLNAFLDLPEMMEPFGDKAMVDCVKGATLRLVRFKRCETLMSYRMPKS